MTQPGTTVSVFVPEALHDRLRRAAFDRNQAKSEVMREALRAYLAGLYGEQGQAEKASRRSHP